MRVHRGVLVGSSFLVLCLALQAPAQERTKWKYEGGYFEKTEDGKWVEHAKDGTYTFAEVEQTDKSILLIDKGRKIAVRLEAEACYVRTGDKGQFKLTYKGGWVDAEGKPKPTADPKDDAPKKGDTRRPKPGDPPAKKGDAPKAKGDESPEKNAEAVKEELAKLEGTYSCVSTEQGTQKGDPEILKQLKLVVKDGRWTVYVNDKVSTVATFTIDPSKKPKAIDLTGTMGGDRGKKYLGIYELNGDDLKLCIGDPKTRPTAFEVKKNFERQLEVWKRVKE